MIDLMRANVKLREAFNMYAWLALTRADTSDLEHAAREVDRRSHYLDLLAAIAPIVNERT